MREPRAGAFLRLIAWTYPCADTILSAHGLRDKVFLFGAVVV